MCRLTLLIWILTAGLSAGPLFAAETASASCFPDKTQFAQDVSARVGAAQLKQRQAELKGKRLGLVVNQSSRLGHCHLVDVLSELGLQVSLIFTPEHGFRGDADAGAAVADSRDSSTGVPVYSLYGAQKAPGAAQLAQVDLLLFDLQDVGTRFYTYLSTLHYVMQAAATAKIPLWLLDRPNPNGRWLDGPLLQTEFSSFVGLHPIPLLHGMTLGELALMIKGEGWITGASALALTVLPVAKYQRDQPYDLPVAPSPNLPNTQAVTWYPTLALFEGTSVSVGRGTAWPFQLLGHPLLLDDPAIWSLTPVSTPGAALNPPWRDTVIGAEDFRQRVPEQGLMVEVWLAWQQRFAAKGLRLIDKPAFFDKLAGSSQLRQQLEQGQTAAQIRQSWQADLTAFARRRAPYLLYP
ncbi:MAG: DUF1343 domain-containing protein [Rheinheimera sp.]|nr:DUF1343 domain-containing protein [Rheinheimera sp.]